MPESNSPTDTTKIPTPSTATTIEEVKEAFGLLLFAHISVAARHHVRLDVLTEWEGGIAEMQRQVATTPTTPTATKTEPWEVLGEDDDDASLTTSDMPMMREGGEAHELRAGGRFANESSSRLRIGNA